MPTVRRTVLDLGPGGAAELDGASLRLRHQFGNVSVDLTVAETVGLRRRLRRGLWGVAWAILVGPPIYLALAFASGWEWWINLLTIGVPVGATVLGGLVAGGLLAWERLLAVRYADEDFLIDSSLSADATTALAAAARRFTRRHPVTEPDVYEHLRRRLAGGLPAGDGGGPAPWPRLLAAAARAARDESAGLRARIAAYEAWTGRRAGR